MVGAVRGIQTLAIAKTTGRHKEEEKVRRRVLLPDKSPPFL